MTVGEHQPIDQLVVDTILCVPGTLLAVADLLIRRQTCPGMIPRWR
jgi:hypothetical protein